MSFRDTLKDKLGMAKSKAPGLAQQHGDKIESGMDKAAHTVDSKTGGKYTDKIQTGTWAGQLSYSGTPAPLAAATFFGERQ